VPIAADRSASVKLSRKITAKLATASRSAQQAQIAHRS